MKYICLEYIEPGKFEGMTEDERHSRINIRKWRLWPNT